MMTVAIFLIFFLFVVEVFRNCLLQKRADLPPYKRWSYLSYNNSQKYLDEKRFKRIQNTELTILRIMETTIERHFEL